MPIDPVILGFSNVWYTSGLEHAILISGPKGPVRIVDAVHFCATKIEAFLARGEGDFFHHDIEDLLAVIDARSELLEEMIHGPAEVREFIGATIRDWLADGKFVDALAGNLAGDPASQARQPILLGRLSAIAALAGAAKRVRPVASPQPAAITARPQPTPGWSAPMSRARAPLPSRVSLHSSHLRSAAYDQGSQVLTVEFQNGSTYAYNGVSANLYAGLLGAASHGRYFNQWIKDRYASRRL